MEALYGILIFIHIVAFVAGGSNSVVMPILGSKIATATPDGRALIFSIQDTLSKVGKYAMVALLVTGPLVFWLKWGFAVPNFWFWVKMALIVVMLVSIGMSEVNGRKARAGDASAAAKAKQAGMITGLAFAGVLFSAVFAFA